MNNNIFSPVITRVKINLNSGWMSLSLLRELAYRDSSCARKQNGDY